MKGTNMSNDTNVYTVSTKPEKNLAAKKTTLTVNWQDCPQSVVRALATQQLIVKLQSNWRKHGIPEKFTANVADYGPGTRMTSITPEQATAFTIEVAKGDTVARRKLLEQLMAMEEAEAEENAA